MFEVIKDFDIAMAIDALNQTVRQVQTAVEYEVADTKLSDYKTIFNVQEFQKQDSTQEPELPVQPEGE
jgi:hypothetical protein